MIRINKNTIFDAEVGEEMQAQNIII